MSEEKEGRGARSDIVPIFVLGSGRSGTTWICNELSCHDRIAGAHHLVHWGSQESVILRTHLWAGNLTAVEDYIRFHEVYSSSDYFVLTQGDKDWFYEHRPTDFFDYFLTLMDRFAEKNGRRRWITKLDPFFFYYPRHLRDFLERIDGRYKTCKWVGISRSFPDVIRSAVNNEGDRSAHLRSWLGKYAVVATYSARHVVEGRGQARLLAERGGLPIAYEELRRDRDTCLARLCAYLGVRHDASRRVPYKPNSSYVDPSRPRHDTRPRIFLSVAVLRPLFSALPWLALGVVRLRERMRGRPCPLNWRLQCLWKMPRTLAEELLRSGQTGLHRQVFDAEGNLRRTGLRGSDEPAEPVSSSNAPRAAAPSRTKVPG